MAERFTVMETTEGAAFSVAVTMAVRRTSEGEDPWVAVPGAETAGAETAGAEAPGAAPMAKASNATVTPPAMNKPASLKPMNPFLVRIFRICHLFQAQTPGRGPGTFPPVGSGQD